MVVLFLIYCTVTYRYNCKDVVVAGNRYVYSSANTEVSLDKHALILDERDLYPEIFSNGIAHGPDGLNRYPDLLQIMRYNISHDFAHERSGRDQTRLYV